MIADSNLRARALRIGRHAGLSVAIFAGLAGCAHLPPGKHRQGTAAPLASPARQSVPVATAPAPSLASIVNDQLQHGHYDEGGRALRRYLQAHPDDRAARGMLRQLEADPEQWLGHHAEDYVTRPGDSYSTLAQRTLGDASLFLVLARYNHASDPSLLLAGQTIRLPRRVTRLDDAAPAVDHLEGAVSETAPPTAAPPAEDRAAASVRLQKTAVTLLAAGKTEDGMRQLDRALVLDPALASLPGDTAALRGKLVAACHERAIVLYRDQRLDPAIALWDRVLVIQPGYEPAVAYRARALELKRRLKQY